VAGDEVIGGRVDGAAMGQKGSAIQNLTNQITVYLITDYWLPVYLFT
jgi:hypothetical protein